MTLKSSPFTHIALESVHAGSNFSRDDELPSAGLSAAVLGVMTRVVVALRIRPSWNLLLITTRMLVAVGVVLVR